VLTTDALAFVAELHRRFGEAWRALMSEGEPPAPVEGEFQDRRIAVAADGTVLVDFQSPNASWAQRIERHLQLKDAGEARVVARPRGLRATEEHVTVDGQPISAGLVDFGLHAFRSAAGDPGAAVYCDLSLVDALPELRLWDDVFLFAEQTLGLAAGSIKVIGPPRA
jgi:malate synthase